MLTFVFLAHSEGESHRDMDIPCISPVGDRVKQYHSVDDLILAKLRKQERHRNHLALPATLCLRRVGERGRIDCRCSFGKFDPAFLQYIRSELSFPHRLVTFFS